MSDLDEKDDSEASYRRGYEQGAVAAAEAAVKLASSPDGLMRLLNWASVDVHRWRIFDRLKSEGAAPDAAKLGHHRIGRYP